MAAVFLLPLPKIFGVKDTLDMSAFELTELVIIKVFIELFYICNEFDRW